MKKWVCNVCGYEVEADEPPEECAVCGVDASHFEES
jgi:rubrerythrin